MNRIHVKIKCFSKEATIPKMGSNYAAGSDLYACIEEPVTIKPRETQMIPLGFGTSFDPDYVALVYARSGLATKEDLAPANKVCVIDADYRGEWKIPVHNHGTNTRIIEPNERIAQVVFSPVFHPDFESVESLDSTERGEGGFGSTGTV